MDEESNIQLLVCAKILRTIMYQVRTACYENDPPNRQHPQGLVISNRNIRDARQAIAILEDAGIV